MSVDVALVAAIVGTVVPAIGAGASRLWSRLNRVELVAPGMSIVFSALDEAANRAAVEESPGAANDIAAGTVSDPEVERAVSALEERLHAVEKRFPDSATIDKISSVNDAIMATKLEELQRSLERIEKRFDAEKVSKWDVATIVFTIIGSIGAVIGIVFGIIKFVQG